MDDFIQGPAHVFLGSDGWKESSVMIALPRADSKNGGDESSSPQFEVDGVWHQSIVDIIISAWQDPTSSTYHLRPYHLFYKGGDDRPPERVYGEAYSSDLFLEMDTEIQTLSPEPGCTLERIASPLMLWSDSTHLTNFGTASMWPIYIQLANQSKYVRTKPTAFASHHLAYLPSVCHKVHIIVYTWHLPV
jgi:Plavaka transposase